MQDQDSDLALVPGMGFVHRTQNAFLAVIYSFVYILAGAYEFSSDFKTKKGFSMVSRKGDPSLSGSNFAPGPGAYNPEK